MTFQEAALMVIKSFADEDEQGFLIAADALNELGMEPTADRLRHGNWNAVDYEWAINTVYPKEMAAFKELIGDWDFATWYQRQEMHAKLWKWFETLGRNHLVLHYLWDSMHLSDSFIDVLKLYLDADYYAQEIGSMRLANFVGRIVRGPETANDLLGEINGVIGRLKALGHTEMARRFRQLKP